MSSELKELCGRINRGGTLTDDEVARIVEAAAEAGLEATPGQEKAFCAALLKRVVPSLQEMSIIAMFPDSADPEENLKGALKLRQSNPHLFTSDVWKQLLKNSTVKKRGDLVSENEWYEFVKNYVKGIRYAYTAHGPFMYYGDKFIIDAILPKPGTPGFVVSLKIYVDTYDGYEHERYQAEHIYPSQAIWTSDIKEAKNYAAYLAEEYMGISMPYGPYLPDDFFDTFLEENVDEGNLDLEPFITIRIKIRRITFIE